MNNNKIYKTMKKILGFILVILIFTSCVTTQVANLQKETSSDIEIFYASQPNKEYTEIMYIQANGGIFHSPEKILEKLKERANKEGADAIINIKFDYQFWWPNVSGIAIKYK
ncbi:MAG: hypothetical protein PWQ43_108 [Rikenellaceae bacterium]|nr:hypothetical protein [Rikenellaceae bacterium]